VKIQILKYSKALIDYGGKLFSPCQIYLEPCGSFGVRTMKVLLFLSVGFCVGEGRKKEKMGVKIFF